jgi:hypothetical protein
MATSLGVDTVCEGVETREQARFLREIGCSKQQGYFYMKPVPLEPIQKKYTEEITNGFEDPRQSSYYDTMGKFNLYDLSFMANKDDSIVQNTFDTVPMGVMEIRNDYRSVKYVRTNHAFREFMQRGFGFDLSDPNMEFPVPEEGEGSGFMRNIITCMKNGKNRTFFDDKSKIQKNRKKFQLFFKKVLHF